MFSPFSRRPELKVEQKQPDTLALVVDIEQVAYQRMMHVREAFNGLLFALFPDNLAGNKVFDELIIGRRAWLHHLNNTELGGSIITNEAKTSFSWLRQSTPEILTVQTANEDRIRYELDIEQQSLVKVTMDNGYTSVRSERGQQGIERLERIAATFGELALSCA